MISQDLKTEEPADLYLTKPLGSAIELRRSGKNLGSFPFSPSFFHRENQVVAAGGIPRRRRF